METIHGRIVRVLILDDGMILKNTDVFWESLTESLVSIYPAAKEKLDRLWDVGHETFGRLSVYVSKEGR